tara:strand:+ start:973 stop:1455 length:483 start_codon:yes stop_codon:yes gene_type:complete
MKEYIKSNELNKKAITLGLKKTDMIKTLKKLGHWDSKNDKIELVFKSKKKEESKPKKKVEKKKEEKKEEPKILQIKDKRKFKILKAERGRQIKQFRRETSSKKTPLQILGIKPVNETPELIKKRCRELQLKNHPDKGGDKDKFDLVRQSCELLIRTTKML